MRTSRFAALVVVVIVAATACLGQEAPDPEEEVFVPTLTVSDQPSLQFEDFGYEPGEPTGFTAHLSENDALTHGLPRVLEFVGRTSGAGTSIASEKMTAYEGEAGLPIPERFECFGPIDIRNAQGETILTVGNFCPADNRPSLTIFGDMSAGTPLGWVFESPGGLSRNNIDDSGNIVDNE